MRDPRYADRDFVPQHHTQYGWESTLEEWSTPGYHALDLQAVELGSRASTLLDLENDR